MHMAQVPESSRTHKSRIAVSCAIVPCIGLAQVGTHLSVPLSWLLYAEHHCSTSTLKRTFTVAAPTRGGWSLLQLGSISGKAQGNASQHHHGFKHLHVWCMPTYSRPDVGALRKRYTSGVALCLNYDQEQQAQELVVWRAAIAAPGRTQKVVSG